MEIKPYWVLVAGFIILLLFVILIVTMPPRPHWLYMGYRPGHYIPESGNWFGPGGTRHLFYGTEGFAGGSSQGFAGSFAEGFAGGSSQGFAGSFAEGFAGGSDATFTMFGTEWCGYCKSTKPVFFSLAPSQDNPTVTIGGKVVALRFVNPEEDKASASGYKIEGYPTLYLDYNGTRTKYDRPARDAQSFQAFLEENLSL